MVHDSVCGFDTEFYDSRNELLNKGNGAAVEEFAC